MTEIDIRDELCGEFECQAEWRRTKAAEYPEDDRNGEAAEIFDLLAASTKDMDLAVVSAYRDLFEDCTASEEWQEMLRQVGFHRWPATADELCREFISNRIGGYSVRT